MGVESNNYVFESGRCDAADLVAALEGRGAVPGESNLSFVLSSSRHWIDGRVTPGSAGRRPNIEFRLALTNSPEAVGILVEVLGALLAECGGVVIDRASGDVHKAMESQDRDQITQTWTRRQGEFAEHFGAHVWPISGAAVFPRLRKLDR